MKITEISLTNDIAVVFVLYYPEEPQVKQTISAIEYFPIAIVIDNSPISCKQLEEKKGNLTYLHFPDNAGMAKALNIAADYSLKQNMKFLLTMDQDSLFPFEKLHLLRAAMDDLPDAGIVAAWPWHELRVAKPKPAGIDEVLLTLTSGNLLRLEAWINTGGFDEKIFIDFVDTDFCLVLREAGYKTYIHNEVIMTHSQGNIQRVKIFGKRVHVYHFAPIRWYYRTRNLFYLVKKHKHSFREQMVIEKRDSVKEVLKMLLIEKDVIKKCRYILKGFLDFLLKRFGKINS